MQHLDGDNRGITYTDGSEFVAATREFPCGRYCEIRLAGGLRFQRTQPQEPWTCVSGSYKGQSFGEIEFCFEEYDEGTYAGCAELHVIAHKVSVVEVDL